MEKIKNKNPFDRSKSEDDAIFKLHSPEFIERATIDQSSQLFNLVNLLDILEINNNKDRKRKINPLLSFVKVMPKDEIID